MTLLVYCDFNSVFLSFKYYLSLYIEVWPTPFYGKLVFVIEGGEFFQHKNRSCKMMNYFRIFWILQAPYVHSTTTNLKTITSSFILICWNFGSFSRTPWKFTIELFDKKDVFPFFINYMPYLGTNIPSKILHTSVGLIGRTTTHLSNMVKHVNLLLLWIKKHGSECTSII